VLTWLPVVAYISVGIAVIVCNAMLVDVSVRGHRHRWPLYASVAVLGFESMVCFFAGSDEWTEQYTEGVASAQAAAVHARFAIELCAIGALDLLAAIVLIFRRWGWLWWLVIAMQLGVLVLAQIEAQVIDPNSPGWSEFSRFLLSALVLLFVFRLAQTMQKRPVDRNLTPSLTP